VTKAPIRPAFSSTKEAAAFGLLLLLVLTAPLWMTRRLLPPREQAYATQGWKWGAYPWIRSQIFEETNDIDIAFLGSSHMGWGIDAPQVQQVLDARLGRKSVVRSLNWGGADFDALYFITKDLLEHRQVKTLVFYDETSAPDRNPLVPVWFRWGDDSAALNGLALRDRIPFYFAAIVGMPRNLTACLRPNLLMDLSLTNSCQIRYRAANPVDRLGSLSSQRSINDPPDGSARFSTYAPENGIQAADVCVYSAANKDSFVFLNQPLPAWQLHFAGEFAALARRHGCRLVLIHLPVLADFRTSKIQEKQYWPDAMHADLAMIGIPSEKFFAGLTDEQCGKLYADSVHLNQNGQRYFTALITPALVKIHEESTRP
jgi:hypothetical protein